MWLLRLGLKSILTSTLFLSELPCCKDPQLYGEVLGTAYQ